jgi:hypothetical protein
MNPARIFLISCVTALSACSTAMPTPPSGFLSDYTALTSTADASTANRAALDAIDPAQVAIDTVIWRANAATDISAEERDTLVTTLRNALAQRVKLLPSVAQGRPAILRAAITRVETVSPSLNTVGTLLLIGPLDRGGAAVEVEAIDPQTGLQLAALTQGYFAPLSDLKARFSKLAPAEIALHKAAADFAVLLDPALSANKAEPSAKH